MTSLAGDSLAAEPEALSIPGLSTVVTAAVTVTVTLTAPGGTPSRAGPGGTQPRQCQ